MVAHFSSSSSDSAAPRLHVASLVRQQGPFFFGIGFLFGLAQLISFAWFNHSDWGAARALEHLAVPSCMMLVLMLIGARAVFYRPLAAGRLRWVQTTMNHVSSQVAAIAVAGAFVVAGMSAVAAGTGAAARLPLFILFATYLVGLAEFAVHVGQVRPVSKAMPYLLGILLATPFVARIV